MESLDMIGDYSGLRRPFTLFHYFILLRRIRVQSVWLRWLNTVLRAVSGNSRNGACFKLDNEQTWRRKKQWCTDDDFSKSTS